MLGTECETFNWGDRKYDAYCKIIEQAHKGWDFTVQQGNYYYDFYPQDMGEYKIFEIFCDNIPEEVYNLPCISCGSNKDDWREWVQKNLVDCVDINVWNGILT